MELVDCLDALYVAKTSVFIASCSHSFHAKCVIRASSHGHTKCPLCRTEIDEFVTSGRPSRGQNLFFEELQALARESSDAAVATTLVAADWPVLSSFQSYASHVEVRAIPSLRTALPNMPFDVLFEIKANSTSTRRTPTDWVVLADMSASMNGPKFDMLKRSLHWMVDNMTRSDRMCLITFQATAQVRSGFVSGEDDGKVLLHDLLIAMEPGGGTNVHAAVEKASVMLSRRLQRNPQASVLLISDVCGIPSPENSPVPGMMRRMRRLTTLNAVILGRDVVVGSEVLAYVNSCNGACVCVQNAENLQGAVAALVAETSWNVVRDLKVTVENVTGHHFHVGTRVRGAYAGLSKFVGPYIQSPKHGVEHHRIPAPSWRRCLNFYEGRAFLHQPRHVRHEPGGLPRHFSPAEVSHHPHYTPLPLVQVPVGVLSFERRQCSVRAPPA